MWHQKYWNFVILVFSTSFGMDFLLTHPLLMRYQTIETSARNARVIPPTSVYIDEIYHLPLLLSLPLLSYLERELFSCNLSWGGFYYVKVVISWFFKHLMKTRLVDYLFQNKENPNNQWLENGKKKFETIFALSEKMIKTGLLIYKWMKHTHVALDDRQLWWIVFIPSILEISKLRLGKMNEIR